MFSRDSAPGGGSHSTGSGWVVVARRVPGPTYTQHHLGPAMSYTFLVRAENSHGLSPPSPISTPVILSSNLKHNTELDNNLKEARLSLSAGHIVELTSIQPVSSTSIKLGWEVSIYTSVKNLKHEKEKICSYCI